MEATFYPVVERVFSNWTALKLAVEHNMGGPNSQQTAIDIINYMTKYCTCDPAIGTDEIREALEDIMDEEFDTICEDDSIPEVSQLLYNFVQLLRQGNSAVFETELNKLPPTNNWLIKNVAQRAVQVEEDSSEDETCESNTNMEVDTEWTEVKSRRRR